MEVSDQPNMNRHLFGMGVLLALTFTIMFAVTAVAMVFVSVPRGFSVGAISAMAVPAVSSLVFLYLGIRFGRGEFFSYSRFPVRFSYADQKVYALCRRPCRLWVRGKLKPVETCHWDSSSIFCVHREVDVPIDHYTIRCYRTDNDGIVTGAFTIGRDWDGIEGLGELLAQWNYWCCYMNQGPAAVPKPVLFLPTNETPHESFLYCVYATDFNASPGFRIAFLPMFILLAIPRILALWTSREPVWPDEIARRCEVDPDDPFDEPRGDTPVGWHATTMSKVAGRYPTDLRRPTEGWAGDTNCRANALRWAEDVVKPVVPVPAQRACRV
ncbi:DUF6708 domain-containing protein [Pseudoduganella plicata]